MTVKQLAESLNLTLITEATQKPVTSGYTSDLLSDVMGNAADDSVLVTIQAHKNTVAVATLAGINAIVLCNKRPVPDDMADAARENEITLMQAEEDQFTLSWKIHDLLQG